MLIALPFGRLLEVVECYYWWLDTSSLPSLWITAVQPQEGFHGAVSEWVYPSASLPHFALLSWMPWGLSSSQALDG